MVSVDKALKHSQACVRWAMRRMARRKRKRMEAVGTPCGRYCIAAVAS